MAVRESHRRRDEASPAGHDALASTEEAVAYLTPPPVQPPQQWSVSFRPGSRLVPSRRGHRSSLPPACPYQLNLIPRKPPSIGSRLANSVLCRSSSARSSALALVQHASHS